MKISDRSIERQIEALEAVHGTSERIRHKVKSLNVIPYIAPVYTDLHNDICQGGHTFYNLPGGRGSGKSSFVALEIVLQIMKDASCQSNAMVIRKYANTLRQSVFNQIQWAIDALGVSSLWKHTVMPMQFIYVTGQVIRFSGLDDPTKLKSLKPSRGYFRILWIEEFSEICGESELRNLQQSVMRGGDRFLVFRSFNPPISSANWANQFIERPDKRSVMLRTNYLQMPVDWLGQGFIEEAERLKEINENAYLHEYMGMPVGNGSEVFPALQIREITEEEIRNSERIYCGLDFGFASDPSAFVRVTYSPKTETIMIIGEIYKRGLSNRELARMIKEQGYDRSDRVTWVLGDAVPERQLITADCADPRSISDLSGEDLRVTGCTKFPGCIEYRIRWLQHRKIVIDPKRTPETAREFRNYSYKVDRKTGEITSQLQDHDDHTIDATAYALNTVIYKRRFPA